MLSKAWVEFQYAKGANNGATGTPANMSGGGLGSSVTMAGVKEDKTGEAYNNPFEMVPTTGALFKQMSSTFLSVTSNEGKESPQDTEASYFFADPSAGAAHDNKAYKE